MALISICHFKNTLEGLKQCFWTKNTYYGAKKPNGKQDAPPPLNGKCLKLFPFFVDVIANPNLGNLWWLVFSDLSAAIFFDQVDGENILRGKFNQGDKKNVICVCFSVNLLPVEFETRSSWRLISSRVCAVCGAQLCTTT